MNAYGTLEFGSDWLSPHWIPEWTLGWIEPWLFQKSW